MENSPDVDEDKQILKRCRNENETELDRVEKKRQILLDLDEKELDSLIARHEEEKKLELMRREHNLARKAFYKKHYPAMDPKTRRYVKKYSEMTNHEIVSLCDPSQRDRAISVVDKLRTYLQQVTDSQGFDADAYPGHFHELTYIYPCEPNPNPVLVRKQMMCECALEKYNSENVEKKTYKYVEVEKINERAHLFFDYFITFHARELLPDNTTGELKTFQAMVQVFRMPPNQGLIEGAVSCRLKPVV